MAKIDDIAKISEEQASAIQQINVGIDQIASVVHNNSATAEESATASEELSGQANMVKEMVAQFKLRGENSSPVAAAAPAAGVQVDIPDFSEKVIAGDKY